MQDKIVIPPSAKTREDLRAQSLSKAIDTIGQANFLPHVIDYLRVDVPFVGVLLLLLDERSRPFHIYDILMTCKRIRRIYLNRSQSRLLGPWPEFCNGSVSSNWTRRLSLNVPELKRCGYKDAKLSHALNMTSGVRFVEDYNMPESDMTRIDIASGWRPFPDGAVQPTIRDVILTLPKVKQHGSVFEYKSVETDVVAWALERAANKSLAELVSELIWKKIGAEQNAFFTVDRAGTALADGGFNATLRDYARFGLMMQNNGRVGRVEVVPSSWVDEFERGDSSLYGAPYTDTAPEGAYSNFWWVNNIEKGDFMARGVFGQMIYVNRRADLTIVKLSTWPDYVITNFTRDSFAAFRAIQTCLS